MTRVAVPSIAPRDILAEQTLLLACSRTHIDPETDQQIRELAGSISHWPFLMQSASNHKVWPLVYRALASTHPDTLPQTVLDQWRKSYLAHSARNLRMARELVRIVQRLESHEIRCLPYKGPVLAESVYGDLSLRQFSDLDILVSRRDVEHAVAILKNLGYGLRLEGDVPRAAYLQSMHHYTLARERGGSPLELHWSMSERYFAFALETEGLWERREIARLIEHDIPTFGAEDNLIALAVHGCKHGWEQLGLVCDVAELARHDVDFGAALQRAHRKGGERMVLLALILSHRLLGRPLADEVRVRVEADPSATRLAAQVHARLFTPGQTPRSESERVRFFRFHFQARERLRDRIRSLLHLFFTPSQEDWGSLRLPPSLSFLHYILRPLRLATKHAGRLFRHSPH